MSKWIDFVKDWAKKHNMTYAKALKDPKMKEAYKSPKMKGGATKEQRQNALLLRSRVKDNDTTQLLNMIVHSADTPAEIKEWEKTIGRRQGRTQIYKDYTENPTYVEDDTEPTPVDILNRAFKEYFDNLDKVNVNQLIDNPHLFPADGFFIPAHFLPRWVNIKRKIEEYYANIEPDEEDIEPFWTDPNNPIVKEWSILDKRLRFELPAPTTTKEQRAQLKKEMVDFMEEKILPSVRAYNALYGFEDGFNPEADYSKAVPNKKGFKEIIQFPVKYANLVIQGKGMKIKHL